MKSNNSNTNGTDTITNEFIDASNVEFTKAIETMVKIQSQLKGTVGLKVLPHRKL